MRLYETILVAALAGMMLAVIPADAVDMRFNWQLISLWLAGAAFSAWLSSWWRRLFFVAALVSCIRWGPVAVSYLSLVSIAAYLAAVEGYRRIDPGWIAGAMMIAAEVLLIWGLLQITGRVPYFEIPGPSAQFGPLNRVTAGAFFAMTLPAFFTGTFAVRGRALPRALLAVIPIAGVVFCRAATGFAAAGAAFAVYVLYGRHRARKIVPTLAAGLVLAGAVFWHIDKDAGLGVRLPLWRHVVLSYRSEALGRGLGSFKQIFPLLISGDREFARKTAGYIAAEAHNEYLQAGFELGLPVTGLILAFLAVTYGRTWRRREILDETGRAALAGLAATAAAAFGFHIFHVAPAALLGCAWLACAEKAGLSQPLGAKFKGGLWGA